MLHSFRQNTCRARSWAQGLLAFCIIALGAGGCASVQRSDVEQWYKEGHIDQAEYEILLQKIDAGEKPAAPSPGTAPVAPPASRPAP